ncbi:MAG: alpha/beta hydrolase family protein [Acidobacteriota bacterium]
MSSLRIVVALALCSLLVAAVSVGQAAGDLAPLWQGSLEAGGARLRLVLHLARLPSGALTASLDSPDQAATGLPVDEVVVEGQTLRLTMRRLGARFEGAFDAARTSVSGTWSQGGVSLPLTLRASRTQPPPPERPQEPKPPFPYDQLEVEVANAAAAVTLAGTLTVPRGQGPWPAVVLLSGSGSQDRDETVFGHRPFLVLADHLTRHGVAVLRLDDRGVGGSKGGSAAATTEDFAGDALAAVAFLHRRAGIDGKRVGLLGHSEGGLVAVMAAARSADVAFAVLLATPALPGEQVLHLQNEKLLRASGGGDTAVEAARAINGQVYRIVREEKNTAAASAAITKVLAEKAGITGDAAAAQVAMVLSPWFRYFLVHDPRPELARLRVPVLALWGEKDLQVPAEENLAALRGAVPAARAGEVTTRVFPGLNHLFQPCRTGLPAEYGTIERTMAPEVLTAVSEWLARIGRRS